MKKIPFYNPTSPFFFHIAVLLFFILLLLLFSLLSFLVFSWPFIFSFPFFILLFCALYPFFVLVTAILVRRAYINTHQAPVSEQFANKLVLCNRLLISVIYILSLTAGWFMFAELPFFDGGALLLIPLLISVPCFLFHLFIQPKLIRFIILKKGGIKSDVIISAVLFFLFLLILLILFLIIFD